LTKSYYFLFWLLSDKREGETFDESDNIRVKHDRETSLFHSQGLRGLSANRQACERVLVGGNCGVVDEAG